MTTALPAPWKFRTLALWFVLGGFSYYSVHCIPFRSTCAPPAAILYFHCGLGLCLFGMVAVRTVIAFLRDERNRRWVMYSWLCALAAIWIPLLVALVQAVMETVVKMSCR